MRKTFTLRFLLAVAVFNITVASAQVIVNYDFNTGSSYAALTPFLAPGVTSTATSSEPFATVMGGTASSVQAFANNATPGAAIIMNNSSGFYTKYFQFYLSGTSLINYSAYKIYFQAQSSATGATTIKLSYSTDGTSFTDFPVTFASSTGSYTEVVIDLSAVTSINNTPDVYFRLSVSGASGSGSFRIDNFQIERSPQYFRTQNSGDWNAPATWVSSPDNLIFSYQGLSPTAYDKNIVITTGKTVTVNSPISLDETQIDGTLQILSPVPYASIITIGPAANTINISTGGKIEVGDGTSGIGTGYEAFATSANHVWNNGSVFEWNQLNAFPFGTNIIYFPNVSAAVIPTFLISKTTNAINGTAAILNGLLKVNFNFSLNNTGTVKFRDGISGNSVLTLNNTGSYTITSPTAIIGETVTIILNKNLNLTNGITVPTTAAVNILGSSANGISKVGGNFLVDGIANMGNTNMSNSSDSVIVNGTFKTSCVAGLYNTGVTAISTGTVILNTGSTIEYNALVNQNVQAPQGGLPEYYNVTFSGAGRKIPLSSLKPLGTIYITGAAILDASSNNVGDSTATTNLKMDGGRFILGTTGTLPSITGLYDLTGGVIQYNNSASGQTIRSPKTYYNIEVTGTSVGNSFGNINIASGGSFTIKSGGKFYISADQITGATGIQMLTVEAGATFQCANADGFSGGNGSLNNITSIKSDIETIQLLPNSNVSYVRNNNQKITNQISYQNIIISGAGIKTAPAGTLITQGDFTGSGGSSFMHNNGTILLNGTAPQTFAGFTYYDLILSNGNKITAGNSTIIDSIKINNGTNLSISNADTIMLHSDNFKTGRVGQIGTGTINYNTSGKFLAERYIPAKKAWRFLAIPMNSPQTIKQAWQENASLYTDDFVATKGTQITSNSLTWLADGFDLYSQNGPSMKYYNPATDTYTGITKTTSLFDVSKGGYMTFIRGDRTANSFSAPATSTTLRITGKLFTGNQPPVNLISGQIIPVNNPYASPIDLRRISNSPNVFYYIWDPNLTGSFGLGGFQTLFWNGADYELVLGNTGSYGLTNNFIESGQAFFASTLGPDTSMQVTENIKSISNPITLPFVPAGIFGQRLKTILFAKANSGAVMLMDGIINDFGDSYSNVVDGLDAKKINNFGENISIRQKGLLLSIERKHTLTQNDTIFLNLSGTKSGIYSLRFIAENITNAHGYVEDTYLHSRTLLNLNGTTDVNFSVENVNGSYAADRFRIVFAPAVVLPVTFTSVKAYHQDKEIDVEWKVENELNIRQYEVEKSMDGTTFKTLAIKAATANAGRSAVYMTVDISPVAGYNYYRVKSVDINGKTAYTSIVKVLIGTLKQDITIYPNPITDGMVHLQLLNQPGGTYKLRLLNKLGQTILSKQITHVEGSSTEFIKWDFNLAHGMYQLEITKPGGEVKNIELQY